jgi:hypothetical protein
MAAKILFKIWDTDVKKLESATTFDTVAAFLTHVQKFKDRKDRAVLKVYVPDEFELSETDIAEINDCRITRY